VAISFHKVEADLKENKQLHLAATSLVLQMYQIMCFMESKKVQYLRKKIKLAGVHVGMVSRTFVVVRSQLKRILRK
jgi:hypothetical protein